MDWLKLMVLSVLQGVAEFLPISSSGHHALASYWLNMEGNQSELTIVLHAGTLLSILCFYWSRVWALLLEDRGVLPKLIVGTIPAAVFGILIKKVLPWALGFDPLDGFPAALISALSLPVTGLMLLSIPTIPRGEGQYQNLTYRSVLLIGMFQAFALLPGISRSGSTIVAGLLTGLKRDSAATFSFLLAIPAILGATVLETKDMLETGASLQWPMLLAGATVSFVVGYLSLKLLVQMVNRGQLHWFAMWTIPLGLIAASILLLQNFVLPDVNPEPETVVSVVMTVIGSGIR